MNDQWFINVNFNNNNNNSKHLNKGKKCWAQKIYYLLCLKQKKPVKTGKFDRK